MGPTGSGKSTVWSVHLKDVLSLISLLLMQFIDIATHQNSHTLGHGLWSYTSDIRSVRASHPISGDPVVFIEVPAFDDTYKSDTEILSMIAEWLVKA